MHSLHEFFTMTKGVEYLIAVTFLIVFPVFWVLLSKKKPESKQKTKQDRD